MSIGGVNERYYLLLCMHTHNFMNISLLQILRFLNSMKYVQLNPLKHKNSEHSILLLKLIMFYSRHIYVEEIKRI